MAAFSQSYQADEGPQLAGNVAECLVSAGHSCRSTAGI